MTYDSVGPVQLSFLRMLSLEATQNFTYTCLNSVAWYDNDNRGYEKSLKLLGDNDDEFSAMHNKPNVIEDGCRVKNLHFSTKCRKTLVYSNTLCKKPHFLKTEIVT